MQLVFWKAKDPLFFFQTWPILAIKSQLSLLLLLRFVSFFRFFSFHVKVFATTAKKKKDHYEKSYFLSNNK